MTVRETAEQLEVSEATVYALCRAGRLGHHRVGLGRGAIRITPEDVARFRAAAHVGGPDAPASTTAPAPPPGVPVAPPRATSGAGPDVAFKHLRPPRRA